MINPAIYTDDEPIHLWFGLSYTSHLVLDFAAIVGLPDEWHQRMTAKLDQLNRAFPDVNPHGVTTLAIAADRYECGDLTEAQMQLIDMATNADTVHENCECGPEPDEDHEADDESWQRYVTWTDERDECEYERLRWYDSRSDEHQRWERVLVPTETEQQARAAGRIVISRTLLQSMPASWQREFIELADRADHDGSYDIRFYTTDGIRTDDPVPHYSRGRTRITPSLAGLA